MKTITLKNRKFNNSLKQLKMLVVICGMLLWTNLSMAAVSVTAPSLTITSCAFPTPYNALGNIVITEGLNADIGVGANVTLILTAPTNFEFQAGTGTATWTGLNITAMSSVVTSSTITITMTITGTNKAEVITISGIMVRGTNSATAASKILRTVASPGTATIAGITNGTTSFGLLTSQNGSAPTITLGSNPSVTQGTTTANLTYSATTNTPNQYSINFDATAEGQGFVDVVDATLPATPIVITVPAAGAAGTYNGVLTVKNSASGCISGNYNPTVTIVAGSSNCGTEDFTNLPTTSSTSYLARSWTGTDGVTWTADFARTDQTMTGKAICFGGTAGGYVLTPTYANGIGVLTFNYVRGFTGTGVRTLQVYINGVQFGADITVNPTSDVVQNYSQTINTSGNVYIEIRSTTTNQVKVDDISWTCYTSTLPVISSSLTASGTVGSAFTYTIVASNTPTSYSATGLPAGLSINTTTGVISGTPAGAGVSNITIGATNGSGSDSETLVLTVSAAGAAPVISSSLTASGTVGSAFTYTIVASNTPTSYSATGLPSGLSINTTTGVISGTPAGAGVSNITIGATNGSGSDSETLVLTVSAAAANENVNIVAYNILNYVKTLGTGDCDQVNNNYHTKGGYMKTILNYTQADIFGISEIQGGSGGQATADEIHDSLKNILNAANYGTWARLPYSSTMGNEFISCQVYWNTDKFTYQSVSYIDVSGGGGTERDVPVVKLRFYKNDNTGNPIDLYVLVIHTTPNDIPADAALRASEMAAVRTWLDANLATGQNIVIMGDMNLYRDTEVAYQNLLTGGDVDTRFLDPINRPGSWTGNSSFADIHTQCANTAGVGIAATNPLFCGASGGSDDRFDFVMATAPIINGTNKISYVSYETVGQDGLHYNTDINNGANASAPAAVIDALWRNSDHLPVKCVLEFECGATLLSSVSTLTGFTYANGSGPSANQTFTISGSGLVGTGNITVTGSTNYEVSLDGTTFAGSVLYPYASGVITGEPKTVYVRLKAGLAVGAYNAETIAISGGSATTINVTCSGNVTSAIVCNFSETFDRADNATVGGGWTEFGGDESIVSNQLVLGTNAANGAEYIYKDVNASYETIFNNAAGTITWQFNMKQSRADPSGLGVAGTYGSAFILGGTSGTFTSGTGYAVILGNGGSPDPIKLVRYSAGVATVVDMISGTAVTNNYASVRVTFNPATGTWELFTRNDGATAFADPSSLGAGNSNGTLVNTTYTATDLIYIGAYWAHATGTTEKAIFDNFCVSVVPVPTLTTSVSTLSGYTYVVGSGPSTSQSFALSGAYLDGSQVVVSAGTNYEVSLNNSTFSSSVNVNYTAPTLASTTIYVRLVSGLAFGTYNAVLVTSNDNGTAADKTVSNSGSVTKIAQTITFGALTAVTYGDATFNLTGTASSGLTVTYTSSNTAVATVSGNVVTIVGNGTCNITAAQAGDGTYAAATNVVQSLTVNKKALTISGIVANNKVYNGNTTASLTGGTLVGIVGADVVTLTQTGTFATANVGTGIAVTSTSTIGGANAGKYTLTQPTGLTANITQAPQTITFGVLANKTTGDAPFNLTATASSGLTVTYVSSNTAICTISGNTVTIVGAGTCNITASQAGNSNYSAATDVVQPFTVTLYVAPDIFISEYAGEGYDQLTADEYIELTNLGGSAYDLTGWTLEYYNATVLETTTSLSGSIGANSALLIGKSGCGTINGLTPSLYLHASTFMNSTGYVILKNNSGTIVDQSGSTSGRFSDNKNYEFVNCTGDNLLVSSWVDLGTGNGTPGVVNCDCTPPASQATGITFSNKTATTIKIDWTRGTGNAVIVVIRESTAVSTDPTNGTNYVDDSDYNRNPGEIGTGNWVVYDGTGTTVTVTDLTANLLYQVSIYEYNTADDCYNRDEVTAPFSMCSNRTLPFSEGFNATTIPGCWSTQVVADPGTNPAITYQASSTYPTISTPAEGTQFVKFNSYTSSDGAEMRLISPPITTTGVNGIMCDFSWYESTLYSTYSDEGVTVQYSLDNGSTWVDVQFYQRYNAVVGWKEKVLSMPSAINNQPNVLVGFMFHSQFGANCNLDNVRLYTCSNPTLQPVGLTLTPTATSMTATITTPGNGMKRMIVVREASAVSFTPVDGTTYEANSIFTDAVDLGSGNKAVYIGTGTSVNVTGLNGSTIYHFAVFELNCSSGSEHYLTPTTLIGSQTTAISPATDAEVVCQTNTTAQISWTLPTGDYTGVIVAARQSTLEPGGISTNASGYTANSVFGTGTEVGSTTPKGWAVYKGTGTTVTVTGLTAGQPYTFKVYAYKNDVGSVWAATQTTTTIAALATKDVTNHSILINNASLQLQWNNPPSTCFDEIMIVANAGAAITTVPTGDGTAYTANLAFGSGSAYGTGRVVYKGAFSDQTVTNLTNGTSYCFTWFVRNGTSWSNGVSACATPALVTILEAGDLAIVAVNTYVAPVSDDEICFFAFKDIAVGTSIEFTDNGYERLYVGKWATSEGTIRMTRSGGGTITAGTTMCFQGMGNAGGIGAFNMFTCGVADNANWTITSLNGTGSYDLNVDDQIWIMQGGSWSTSGTHKGFYSGNILYGWTATGWKPTYGYDDTKGSTIFPGTECFTTDVTVNTGHSKVKYIGAMTSTTQFDWLTRINDDANWQGYTDDSGDEDGADFNNNQANTNYAAGPDYISSCITFPVSTLMTSGSAGVWTGAVSRDWFDCGNWENLRLPTGGVNVDISGAVMNHIDIDNGIPSMPRAECNNLVFNGATYGPNPAILNMTHNNSRLDIYGNLTSNGKFGAYYADGTFQFRHKQKGVISMVGTAAQTITATQPLRINHLLINNPFDITLNNDFTILDSLTLTDGVITTGANKVILGDSTTVMTPSNISFINGNIRQNVGTNNLTYVLPLGNGTATTNYKRADIINNNMTGTTYVDASVASTTESSNNVDANLSVTGFTLTNLLETAVWTLNPDVQPTGGTTYGVKLYVQNLALSSADDNNFFALKRPEAPLATYAEWVAGGTMPAAGSPGRVYGTATTGYAQRTGYTSFSKHAISKGAVITPVELLFFDAVRDGKFVNVNWATATEKNNDYFTVEKSRDVNDFDFVTNYPGAGNSLVPLNYSITDYTPYSEKSYYRLKQTDYDGKYSFSDIVAVEGERLTGENISIVKSDNAIQIEIINNSNTDYYVDVVDMLGRVLYKEKYYSSSNKIMIDLDNKHFAKGVYNVAVYNENEIKTSKIFID